jgi:predicted ATPase/DNA-binding SARP family transcriptional activator
MMDLRWRITLLGALRAEREGHVLSHFRRQKTGILLAYLAYFPHRTHLRDALIELLWPDADLPAGRASLSVAVSFLRQHLEPPGSPPGSVLIADRSAVRLNPDAFATDVAAFEAALRDASRAGSPEEQLRGLNEAAEWYRGELLPGCYDEWALLERERLAEAYLHGLSQLIRLLEAQGDLPRALDYARRAVNADPLREESHQELIRLLGTAGQPQAARRQFAELERLLREDLDSTPSAETRALLASLQSEGSRVTAAEAVSLRDSSEPGEPASSSSPVTLLPSASILPRGTVTFLMTDIEGSTALWDRLGNAFPLMLESHHALLRRLFRQHGGYEVKSLGDGFLVAFQGAGDALACAVALQRALATHSWPPEADPLPSPLRVRLSLHTGEAQPEEGDYRTLVLHLAQRLLAAGHGGQILCSEATATLTRRDMEPGTRLVDLGVYLLRGLDRPERLFQVAYPGMASDPFPPLRAEAHCSGHLPPALNRFFGRERERARLEKLLASEETRLVTLLGPGGSGKTRLALEVARQLVQEWRGAVWFVPLADLTEARRIPEAIRQALQLAPSAGEESLELVAAALADPPALLLLDNLEHLLPEGATPLRLLLERVPTVTCLVTSRQRLNLSGERVFLVPPLPVPGEELRAPRSELRVEAPNTERGAWSLERLISFPSVQLFVDRAQVGSPDFALTEGNAGAVAALCRRLEGLPLALELAAARAGVLTPEQILSQLERGLGVLSSRQADAAARHRSLRAAVEWSYRLLDPTLQRFFTGLSVFQGGWSLEAAEAVSGEPLALDYLEQLRECSLVLAEEGLSGPAGGEEMRFRLLETLREYGREQLGEQERSDLQRRHAAYFLAWAERVREEMRRRQGRERQVWLERLRFEHEDLRAALAWAIEQREGEIALRLAVALGTFWEVRGYLSEGRERLAAVLALTEACEAGEDASHSLRPLRAQALRNAGALAWRQGDYGPARALLEESLAIHRALGNLQGVVSALHILGAVAYDQGDLDTSRAFDTQALETAREIGSASEIAVALHNLATVAHSQGDFETARSFLLESLSLSRELGDRYDMAYCLHGLGLVALVQGDWGSARDFFEEGLALRREVGDRVGIGWSLDSLGLLARDQGDYGAARACLEESLALRRELGDKRGIARSLHGLGSVASQEGEEETAKALLEESLALSRKQGDRHVVGVAVTELGVLLSRQGDYGAARALLEEALAIYREAGNRQGIGELLCFLGNMTADQGDEDSAGRYYRESLAAFRQVGERYGMALVLEGLARIAGARGEAERAAQLYAAAGALREALGAPVPPADRAAHERRVAAIRASLGEEGFAAAWAAGRAMGMEEAIASALQAGGEEASAGTQ